MRTLVLISSDHYVRNFIGTGAFDSLDPEQTFYVSSAGRVLHEEARAKLRELPTYLGEVDDPRPRPAGYYKFLRVVLLAGASRRSRTMRHKLSMLPRRKRLMYGLLALPGLRHALAAAIKARAGLHPGLHQLMEEVQPDLVVAPSGGYETLVWDGMRSARALGITSLLLIHNWDNLSSKGIFAVRPDYLAVWGEQSVEHAERIHGQPRERVRAIGVPSFDHYFRHTPGSTESPFPFRYALFAGCYAPFDERTALERLDRRIEQEGLALKIVYRPHPHRHPRKLPDFVDENDFRHVVIDPQVRPFYEASFEEYRNWSGPDRERLKPLLPSLQYYPALFENAEFVICPLSTMLVEAAIFERRVAVVAYDDGIHENSPAAVLHYDHFAGIDEIDGFTVCRRPEDLEDVVAELASGGLRQALRAPLREQIRHWLFWDERTYAERLGEWVEEIARREGLPAEARPPTPPTALLIESEAANG